MQKNVLLANLFPPHIEKEEAIEDATEMYHLTESLGDVVVMDMVHQRGYPAKSAYLGIGKARDEVTQKVKELDIDIVILNGYAKSRQLYTLWKILAETKRTIEVWDRVDLILNIFAKHARTAESKLQIEIARMRHMGPRMYGMGHVLSQQAGGIGTRGIGETNVELMKRHWKDAMRFKKEELTKLSQQREKQIVHRKKSGLSSVSIIGYTNAGKTTLFNKLTKKGKFADNMLFATLDSTVGKVYLPHRKQELFISDTIGFIKHLPPSLIEALKSTLLESVHADILLHVIDGSNAHVLDQFHVVEQIIADLGLVEKDEIIVVNKSDAILPKQKEAVNARLHLAHPIFVSSQTGEGMDVLITTIESRLNEHDHPEVPLTKATIVSSHEQDEAYIRPVSWYNRRGAKLFRADWRTQEQKDADGADDDWEESPKLKRERIIIKHPNREELSIGKTVVIVEKANQKSGVSTTGIIKQILSHNFSHPHGIKVELEDGSVGRVKQIV